MLTELLQLKRERMHAFFSLLDLALPLKLLVISNIVG